MNKEQLKKPECPLCYISCNDVNCCVINCNGDKEMCNKALYCSLYLPYQKFCHGDENCVQKIKEYIETKVNKGVDDKFYKLLKKIKEEI